MLTLTVLLEPTASSRKPRAGPKGLDRAVVDAEEERTDRVLVGRVEVVGGERGGGGVT